VLALNSATGAEIWSRKLKGGDFVNLVLDGPNLFAATHGEIFRLDPRTGIIRWHNPLRGYGWGLVSIAGNGFNSGAPVLQVEKRRRDEESSSAVAAGTAATSA
jgi:outer membrane protein assembly factor BamB